MEKLKLNFTTPSGAIFNNYIKGITLPGTEGVFSILEGHTSIFAELVSGTIIFHDKNDNKEIAVIDGGYVLVKENIVYLAASGVVVINDDSGELAGSINDIEKLLKGVSNAEAIIATVKKASY